MKKISWEKEGAYFKKDSDAVFFYIQLIHSKQKKKERLSNPSSTFINKKIKSSPTDFSNNNNI